jgi:chromosomal replication initiator protein
MSLWQETLKHFETRFGTHNFETWIKPIHIAHEDNHQFRLEVPSKFFRDWLVEHFLPTIQEELSKLAHERVRITVTINPQLQRPNEPPKIDEQPKTRSMEPTGLIAKYTFENFVVGASNQFAQASCLAVANQPGEYYNPLFLYGGVGLGKTHLINAIGHKVLAKTPNLKVAYLASESFMNELITSLRRDKMDKFKARFRNIDVLILDDIQFLAGKERTQEEFFHTFNSLYENHKQIVITSDRFPKEISGLEDRLRNRFEWGLISDIQPPDMETRVTILHKKAAMENVPLPHDVAVFIASHISSNVRELEGSLTRLGAFSSLTKAEITIDLAKEILHNTLRGLHKEVTVENIQKVICEHFSLKMGELKSRRRTKNIALPRQMAMYLCRKHTSTSFPVIGDKFGGKDHSTVIHASKIIEKRMKTDLFMQSTIETLERSLKT